MYKVRLAIAGDTKQYGVDEGLLDVSISALRIAEVNDFLLEPQRVEMSLLQDGWLVDHLIEIAEMGIGLCEVLKQTGAGEDVVFTGYIDCDNISLDFGNEQIKLTGYSYMQLLVKYGDIDLADLVPETEKTISLGRLLELMQGYILDETGIGISIEQDYENINIDRELEIWSTIWLGNAISNPAFQDIQSIVEARKGFCEYEDRVSFYHFEYSIIRPPEGLPDYILSGYVPVFKGKIFNFYNRICLEVIDLSERENEKNSEDQAEAYLNSLMLQHEREYGTAWNNVTELGGYSYVTEQEGWLTGRVWHKLKYSGNIVAANLVVKEATMLDVLKIFVNLGNLNILSRGDGSLVITNNEQMSTQYNGILDEFCSSFKLSREKRVLPSFEALDSLKGDADLLISELQDYYRTAYQGRVMAEITVDDSGRELEMFSTLNVRDKQYRVVEVQKSLAKDQAKLKAWRL